MPGDIFRQQFYKADRLPEDFVKCQLCREWHWARPRQVLLYASHYTSARNTYMTTSGCWVICTRCIPPRLWVAFFTKYELAESEAA